MLASKRSVKRGKASKINLHRFVSIRYGFDYERYMVCRCGRVWKGEYETVCPSCKRKRN